MSIDTRWTDRFKEILDGPSEIKKRRLESLKSDFNQVYEKKDVTDEALEFYSDVLKELNGCGI